MKINFLFSRLAAQPRRKIPFRFYMPETFYFSGAKKEQELTCYLEESLRRLPEVNLFLSFF